MSEESSTAPEWFARVLAVLPEHHSLQVAGCLIHYLRWGASAKPALLLVHGGGAHAHWWDFIAPWFLEDYQVLAIDLSGMGDSGHRSGYSTELFAQELHGVCQHANLGKNTVLVGHSFGGYAALKAGVLYPQDFAGLVLVDSPVRPPDYVWERDPKYSPVRPRRVYPDLAAAMSRFRLVPAQPCANQFILEHIAKHSLRAVEGGWQWKFDEHFFQTMDTGNTAAQLAELSCRVGVIFGEHSALFGQEVVDYMFGVLDQSVPFVSIPESYHHLFLDQPLAFVAALRTLLAEWRHSKPLRPHIER